MEKNFSKKSFCPNVQRDAKNWRFQKPAENSESFARVETNIKNQFQGKNTFSEEVLDIQSRNVTNLQQKTANCPKLLAQSLNICNKIKLFKNVIYFFSSKVSFVESKCRCDKSTAIFTLNVQEVFTKLRKYLRKVKIRRRPLSAKSSSRRVKSNFVELEERTLPTLQNYLVESQKSSQKELILSKTIVPQEVTPEMYVSILTILLKSFAEGMKFVHKAAKTFVQRIFELFSNFEFFVWSSCRQLEWNFDNSANKTCQTSEKT